MIHLLKTLHLVIIEVPYFPRTVGILLANFDLAFRSKEEAAINLRK